MGAGSHADRHLSIYICRGDPVSRLCCRGKIYLALGVVLSVPICVYLRLKNGVVVCDIHCIDFLGKRLKIKTTKEV